eukprot:scaffold145112_cov30-Tisochrysis_lutea.AAC.2
MSVSMQPSRPKPPTPPRADAIDTLGRSAAVGAAPLACCCKRGWGGSREDCTDCTPAFKCGIPGDDVWVSVDEGLTGDCLAAIAASPAGSAGDLIAPIVSADPGNVVAAICERVSDGLRP